MLNKRTGTMLLLGVLTLFGPAMSHADDNRGSGTMIETRPFETDGHITDKVKQSLAADTMLKGRDIKVATSHAIVTLTGTVNSQEESARAAAMVRRLPEVDKVRNKLKVNPG